MDAPKIHRGQYHTEKPMSVLGGEEETWFRLIVRELQTGKTDLQHSKRGWGPVFPPASRGGSFHMSLDLLISPGMPRSCALLRGSWYFGHSQQSISFPFSTIKRCLVKYQPQIISIRGPIKGKVHQEFKFKIYSLCILTWKYWQEEASWRITRVFQ